MVEQSNSKKVPLSQMEQYLEAHQEALGVFVGQLKRKLIDEGDVESRLPKSFLYLHEVITKILRDNDILPKEEESKSLKVDQFQPMMKQIMRLQNTFLTQNSKNQQSIITIVKTLNSKITKMQSSAAAVSEDAAFLQKLGQTSTKIQQNFSKMQQLLQQHKDQVIQAISYCNNELTADLSNQMKAIATQISSIKSKDNEGEVASLNLIIHQLQQQLETMTDQKTAQINDLTQHNTEIQAQQTPLSGQSQQEECKDGDLKQQINNQSAGQYDSMSQLFDFYNDLDPFKQSDWQFKQDFKYTIVPPLEHYYEDTPIEEMKQIEVILKICTLWKGVPHGLAIIEYTHSSVEYWSFLGVGVFNHGQLHNGPFSCVRGKFRGVTISKMQNGRPADGSYYSTFYEDPYKITLDSLKTEIDMSGYQRSSYQTDKENRENGQKYLWDEDGNIHICCSKKRQYSEAKFYELQRDQTYTLFHVKYDGWAEIEKKEISKGHKKM